MLLLAAATLAIGLAFLILGLRGRRIDDHPICRKCRFDLIGLPLPTSPERERAGRAPATEIVSTAPRCPECGAELAHPRALRTGNRARRRRFLGAATAVIAISLVLGGLAAWSLAKGRSLNTFKPAWMLAWDLSSKRAPAADAAIQEFDTRLLANTLSKENAQSAARRILTRQADTSRSWGPAMGDFIETLRKKAWLSDPDWSSYARHAAVPSLDVRKSLRQGDPAAAILRIAARVGSRSTLMCEVRSTQVTLGDQVIAPGKFRLDAILITQGPPFGLPPHNCEILPMGGPTAPDASFGPGSGDKPVNVAPGRHTLASSWSIGIFENQSPTPGGGGISAQWGWSAPGGFFSPGIKHVGDALAEFTPDLDAPVLVIPADRDTVELVDDERLAASVEAALTPTFHFEKSAGLFTRGSVQGYFTPSNLPIDIAADLFVVEGGHERRAGAVVIRVSGGSNGIDLGIHSVPASGTATLILRPSAPVARRTVDLTRIWGREIVLKDVKIAPGSPWARPAPPPTPNPSPSAPIPPDPQ